MDSEEIRFGRFRLDRGRRELFCDGKLVRLPGRAHDVLYVLASARGEIVSKDELMARLWPGRVVEEGNIYVHVSALRKALDEQDPGRSHIVTVPGHGYRVASLGDSPFAAILLVPDRPSIAVMPFVDLSGDQAQEHVADSMVEEIITALDRYRWFFVMARGSAATFKGQPRDPKTIGGELGARYVLEGSIRKDNGRLRIATQLIDMVTGIQLWADRLDGSIDDVFALQDRVASSVAGGMEPALVAAEIARSAASQIDDLTAYDLTLRARAILLSSARQIPEALRLAELAITRDPRYGPAFAWAAISCYRLVLDGRSEHPALHRLKGIDFARRALEVAGDDSETRANAAVALSFFGEDIDAMTALIDHAVTLNPSFARGWSQSAMRRLWAGQTHFAIEHAETALRLSPRARVGTPLLAIGAAHFLNRRFDEAVPKLLLAIQDDPGFPEPQRFLAACYAHMGRRNSAQEIVTRLRTITASLVGDHSCLRHPEHRELFLSGLRLSVN